jgi:hypothetical protein
MEPIIISVAKDFSITPGSRYKDEGQYSGEEFRVGILGPRFLEAVESGAKIRVILDGVLGYGTSFLEEVFGGLAREHGSKKVLEKLEIISKEEPYLIDDIMGYVKAASSK